MGKKGGWFQAVRKALSSQPKEKKDQTSKFKKNLSFEDINLTAVASPPEEVNVGSNTPPPQVGIEPTKRFDVGVENHEQHNQHAYSVALATAKAAEAAAAAAQAAAEVVRLASMPRIVDKSKEEIAAVKIQTAFRGYMARKALQALRGLMKLKSLVEGQSAKRQAANTLRCMQTLARVQSQIHARRIRMAEENQALQRHLQLKLEKESDSTKQLPGEIWDDTTKSKEQIEASIMKQHEAAMRRERALAYAYTHQSRKNSKSSNSTFMDPNNPQWGWSWLERWMASRPWETKSILEKDESSHDQKSGNNKSFRALSVAGEINRANTLRDHNQVDEPTTNKMTTPSSSSSSSPTASAARKLNRAPTNLGRPKLGPITTGPTTRKPKMGSPDRLDKQRRHSIGGSLVRDDEGVVNNNNNNNKGKKKTTNESEKNEQQQRPPSLGAAKKRLSFPTTRSHERLRRHSLGGKMDAPIETE